VRQLKNYLYDYERKIKQRKNQLKIIEKFCEEIPQADKLKKRSKE